MDRDGSGPRRTLARWTTTTPPGAPGSIEHLDPLGVPYELFACDPALADTAAFCAAYGFSPEDSANTIVVIGKSDPPRYAACVTLAPYRLDVNRTVRDRLGTRKASFAPAEDTAALTGMQIGGVTVFGLPAGPADLGRRPGDDPRPDRARRRVAVVEGHRDAGDPPGVAGGRGRRRPRQRAPPRGMTIPEVRLRPVEDADLPIFLAHQDDPVAAAMAAFPTRAPDAFYEHWAEIRADPTGLARTITVDGVVVGDILSWVEDGRREVGYWIGQEHWGRGYATAALRLLLGGGARSGRSSPAPPTTTPARRGSSSTAASSGSARPTPTASARGSIGWTEPGRKRARAPPPVSFRLVTDQTPDTDPAPIARAAPTRRRRSTPAPTRPRRARRARPGPVQYKGADLEPERGPGLGCFRIQVVVLVIFIILTPLTVAWNWPIAVSTVLLFAVILLLLVTGQTIIFLLRLVAADRRGRRRPLASGSKTVGELEDAWPTRLRPADDRRAMPPGPDPPATPTDDAFPPEGPVRQ